MNNIEKYIRDHAKHPPDWVRFGEVGANAPVGISCYADQRLKEWFDVEDSRARRSFTPYRLDHALGLLLCVMRGGAKGWDTGAYANSEADGLKALLDISEEPCDCISNADLHGRFARVGDPGPGRRLAEFFILLRTSTQYVAMYWSEPLDAESSQRINPEDSPLLRDNAADSPATPEICEALAKLGRFPPERCEARELSPAEQAVSIDKAAALLLADWLGPSPCFNGVYYDPMNIHTAVELIACTLEHNVCRGHDDLEEGNAPVDLVREVYRILAADHYAYDCVSNVDEFGAFFGPYRGEQGWLDTFVMLRSPERQVALYWSQRIPD